MTQRGEQLAERLEGQMSEVIDTVSALAISDLGVITRDPKGPAVGDVLAHLREGTAQVLGWASGMTQAASGDAAAGDAAAGDAAAGDAAAGDRAHGDARLSPAAETADILGQARATLGTAIRGLSDDQLASCPAASPGLSDGTTPLHQVIDFIADDLAGHLRYLREALAGAPADAAVPQVSR